MATIRPVNIGIVTQDTIGNPLSDVNVSRDGTPLTSFSESLLPGTYNYQAWKDGYGGADSSITVAPGDSPKNVVLQLPPIQDAQTVTLQTGQPNILVTLNGQTVSSSDDGSVTFTGVPSGSYSAAYSGDGFASGTLPVVVAPGTNSQAVNLVSTAPTQDPGASNPTAANSPNISAALDSVTPIQPGEQISIQSFQGYFTAAQANLFIGSVHIDELVSLQFTLQANAIPIYGYSDRDAAAYGEGRALVQGQLVINYVADDYMLTVLKEYQSSLNSPDVTVQQSLVSQYVAIYQRKLAIKAGTPLNDLMIANAQARLDAILKDPSSNTTTVSQIKSLIASLNASPARYRNPIYRNVVFDMQLQIGDGIALTTRWLESCKIISNEQIVDSKTGETLYDAYSFIARRLH